MHCVPIPDVVFMDLDPNRKRVRREHRADVMIVLKRHINELVSKQRI